MDRKLPDWLKESREAEKLIAWLKSPDCEVKEFSGQLFIKARYGNCFFFFDCLKENRKTDRNWCAVIHMPEYSLYEAEDLFLKLMKKLLRPGKRKHRMVTVLQQKNLHIPQLYPQKTEVVF